MAAGGMLRVGGTQAHKHSAYAAALGPHGGPPGQPSVHDRVTQYHEASKGVTHSMDQPPISLRTPARDLETVYGAVRHVLGCVEACSAPAYKDSLWHWRSEIQRPQMVRALHMFAVLHECVRVLQDSRHYNGIVEIAKAMILIDFSKKTAKSQNGKDKKEQRRKVKRPKPLAALVRLCATHIPTGFTWQADTQDNIRPSWGGSGQNNTLVSLATFLFRWLALAATGHSRSEAHVYGNVLSLLVEVWDVADKPGVLSRLDNSLDLLYGMDGTLAVWYERVGEVLPEDALVERMFALGVVGMLMKRIAATHASVTKDGIFSKVRSKHAVLEKQILQKLKETPGRRHVAKVGRPRAESAPEEGALSGENLPCIIAGASRRDGEGMEPPGHSAHPGMRSVSADVGACGRDAIILALAPRFTGAGLPPNGTARGGGDMPRYGNDPRRWQHKSLRDEQSEPVLWQAQAVPMGSDDAQAHRYRARYPSPSDADDGSDMRIRCSDKTASPPNTPALLSRDPNVAVESATPGNRLRHGKHGGVNGASEHGNHSRPLLRSQPDAVVAVNGHWGRGISRGLSSSCSTAGIEGAPYDEDQPVSLRPQLARGRTPSVKPPATPTTSPGSRAVRVEPGRAPLPVTPATAGVQLPDIATSPSPVGSECGRAMLQSKMMMAEERNDGVRPYFPTKHMRNYAYRNQGFRNQSPQSSPAPAAVSDAGRAKLGGDPSRAGRRAIEAPVVDEERWNIEMLGGWDVDDEDPSCQPGLAAIQHVASTMPVM